MKKVLLFICLFILPFMVSADMGAPMVTEYKVRVNNKDGANLVDSNKKVLETLAYDTVISIVMEYNIDGKLYGVVKSDRMDSYINLEDTEVLESEVKPSEDQKWEKMTMYVFDKPVYLYKGPSKIYGKVDGNVKIPKGEKITYEYADEMWAYVTYKGTSGWIYIYSYENMSPYNEISSLAYVVDSNVIKGIYTHEEITLESAPLSGDKVGTIPKNKEIEYKYYYITEPYSSYVYVEYEDISGWYYDSLYGSISYIYNDLSLYTLQDVSIYEDVYANEKIGNIPKNVELEIISKADLGLGPDVYYITYKGITGWVSTYDSESALDAQLLVSVNEYSGQLKSYKLNKDVEIFDGINGNSTSKILNANEVVTLYYEKSEYKNKVTTNWYYVSYGDDKVWIKSVDNEDELFTEEVIIEKPIEEDELIESDTKKEELPKMSILEISLYCIGGAIIIALVAIVSIRLINKKRSS